MRGRTLLTRKEIEELASAFRQKYAPGQLGSLDIERILEFQMKVKIVPVKGLCRRHQTKGYTCPGGDSICVDYYIFRDQPIEYRNVLVHETAHISIHRDMLPLCYNSIVACREHQSGISEALRKALEIEAMEWAERVLIPPGQLRTVVDATVDQCHEPLVEMFGAAEAHYVLGSLVVEAVAERFEALPAVCERRLRRDGHWARLGKLTSRRVARELEEQSKEEVS